jgi:hypothetical protein
MVLYGYSVIFSEYPTATIKVIICRVDCTISHGVIKQALNSLTWDSSNTMNLSLWSFINIYIIKVCIENAHNSNSSYICLGYLWLCNTNICVTSPKVAKSSTASTATVILTGTFAKKCNYCERGGGEARVVFISLKA